MKWQRLVRCPKCRGVNADAPFGASFENSFTHRKTCGSCGEYVEWVDSVERWISQSTWWKPWTWRKGYWEKK